jgi:MFS family permease
LVGGIGNSVFHPADFSILNARVSPPRLGHAFSIHSITGSLGFAAAPVFSAAVASLYGWHGALYAAAVVGVAVLALLFLNSGKFVGAQTGPKSRKPFAEEASVLLSAPIIGCFLFFALHAGAFTGLLSFGVAAMTEQFRISPAAASSAITAYMLGSACGALGGGFLATQARRPNFVVGGGLSVAAVMALAIAAGAVPGALLPLALAVSGLAVGVTYPSRDLIVRGSTPPGATGRVYGFVYAGLDVGSLSVPMFYGYFMDHGAPNAVFYLIFGFMVAALLTVLQLVFVANPAAVKKA